MALMLRSILGNSSSACSSCPFALSVRHCLMSWTCWWWRTFSGSSRMASVLLILGLRWSNSPLKMSLSSVLVRSNSCRMMFMKRSFSVELVQSSLYVIMSSRFALARLVSTLVSAY